MAQLELHRWHVFVYWLNFVVFALFSSAILSQFNEVTQKPSEAFNNGPIRDIAKKTNFVIKSGLLHGILYAFEFIFDREMFIRHFGQRLTTLWYQLLQDERHGQHLHMQLETCLQLVDASTRSWSSSEGKNNKWFIKPILVMIGCIFVLQNALTSMAYHSQYEQFVGFCFGSLKLMFDYSEEGGKVNYFVGYSMGELVQWLVGCVSLLFGYYWNDYALLHPTVTVTILFCAGFLLAWILPNSRIKYASLLFGAE